MIVSNSIDYWMTRIRGGIIDFDREYLLLSSYCGTDNADCSERSPCAECLAMCNVFDRDGNYLRQLGYVSNALVEHLVNALKQIEAMGDDVSVAIARKALDNV